MTRQKFTIGAVAAAFMLSIAPAWAQEGARPNSSGTSSGSAAPRGGEGGSSSSSGSSSGGSMSSGGSSMGSSGSSSSGSMGTGGYAGGARERAPERPSAYGRSGGSSGGDRAVSRGGASSDSPRGIYGTPGTASSRGEYSPGTMRDREPVPAYSRPRGDRPVTGTATERTVGTGTLPPFNNGSYYPFYGYGSYDPYYYWGYYDPYYYYYRTRYWLPGYGYGFGYFGYDPFLFGDYYDPYAYQGQGGGTYGYSEYKGVGGIRLKVKPNNAQVYVDGYFVGNIDSFDGTFQKLAIEAGSHKVEVRAEGYEPFQFDVIVVPGETVTYKGELKPIK